MMPTFIAQGCSLIGIVLGCYLWVQLIRRSSKTEMTVGRLVGVIMVLGLVIRIVFSILTPTFYAPDEHSHYNYVKYIAENRALPVQTHKTGALTNDWEYYQPPFYYLTNVPVCWVSERLFSEPVTVRLLRLLSVLLWLGTALLARRILRNLQIEDPFAVVATMAMVSLLPTYVFLSSMINSDNMLLALGAVLLYVLTKPSICKHVTTIIVGCLLGLALLTKPSALVYFAFTGIYVLAQWGKQGKSFFHQFVALLVMGIVAGLMWLPLILRNIHVYGSAIPEDVAWVPATWQSTYYAILATQLNIKSTFWSAGGICNDLSFLPDLGIHVGYFGLVGLVYGWFFKRESLASLLSPESRRFIVAGMFTIAFNFIIAMRYGLAYAQGQGRYLFPMLIPISLLVAVGLSVIAKGTRWSRLAYVHAIGFFATYALGFLFYCLGAYTQL